MLAIPSRDPVKELQFLRSQLEVYHTAFWKHADGFVNDIDVWDNMIQNGREGIALYREVLRSKDLEVTVVGARREQFGV